MGLARDDVNTVKVTGTLDLPEGVAATDVKVVQQGDSTYQANVVDDGASRQRLKTCQKRSSP
ncbi:MAG: hypothetical protein ACLTQI_05965 [Slackia sp.]